jgi:hypothetical protein
MIFTVHTLRNGDQTFQIPRVYHSRKVYYLFPRIEYRADRPR